MRDADWEVEDEGNPLVCSSGVNGIASGGIILTVEYTGLTLSRFSSVSRHFPNNSLASPLVIHAVWHRLSSHDPILCDSNCGRLTPARSR
jgi:hypothetical protein